MIGRLGLATVAATVLCSLLPAASPASAATPDFAAAAAYAESRATVGMAMLDRQTGQYWDNGPSAHQVIPAASVVKVFVAENLLDRDRTGAVTLSSTEDELLGDMIVRSDDDAMSTLYFRYGGNQIVTDVARKYGLTDIVDPPRSGYWGYYGFTAHDVVQFYDGVLSGGLQPADRDYLVSLMREAAPTGADGFDQTFGIPAALPTATWAVKQGWNCCLDGRRELHTTGILGADDRFVLVVLSQYDAAVPYDFAMETLSTTVALLFPDGEVPNGPRTGTGPLGSRVRPI